jgi:hypothetical protein
MVLYLKKRTEGLWRHLIPKTASESKLYNVKLWWEMADQYKSAMKAYQKMVDDEDEYESGGDWKRKKKGKKNEIGHTSSNQSNKKWTGWLSWLNYFYL